MTWTPSNNQYDGVNAAPVNDVELNSPYYKWDFQYLLLEPVTLYPPLITPAPGSFDPEDPEAERRHCLRVMVVPPEKGERLLLMANNPIIGRWKKQPAEDLRYEVDWSRWLLPDEALTAATVHVVQNTLELDPPVLGDLSDPDFLLMTWPPLELSDPYFLDGSLGVVFFVRGGKTGLQYQVTHRVTTSSGQLAEREILYDVEEV